MFADQGARIEDGVKAENNVSVYPGAKLSDGVLVDTSVVSTCDPRSPVIIMQRTRSQIARLSPVQLIDGPPIGMVPRAIWAGQPILVTFAVAFGARRRAVFQ